LSDDNIKDFLSAMGKKSMSLYRYSTRRAFGIYYSIWAMAIFFFVFFFPQLTIFIPEDIPGAISVILMFFGVFFIATYFTVRVFTRAGKAMNLEDVFHTGRKHIWIRAYQLSNILFITVFLSVVVFFSLRSSGSAFLGYIVMYSMLFAISLYLLLYLKISLSRIPLEGYVASFSYMFSSLASILIILIFRPVAFPEMPIQLAWSPTIIAWIFSSMYAFYMAPGELGLYE
jgi:hypothetical protein